MPNTKAAFLLVMFSLVALSAAGCSSGTQDKTTDGTGDHSDASADAPAASTVQLYMTTQTYNVKAGDYDDAKILQDPTPAQIEEAFKALDWKNPDLGPIIKLSRPVKDQAEIFVLRRGQDTADNEIRATWQDSSGARASPPIDDPNVGLGLVLAFAAKDPKLIMATKWQPLE